MIRLMDRIRLEVFGCLRWAPERGINGSVIGVDCELGVVGGGNVIDINVEQDGFKYRSQR